jgi:hypothetical protein
MPATLGLLKISLDIQGLFFGKIAYFSMTHL